MQQRLQITLFLYYEHCGVLVEPSQLFCYLNQKTILNLFCIITRRVVYHSRSIVTCISKISKNIQALFIQHGASCQSLPTLSPYTHSYKVQVIVGSSLSDPSYFFSFISIQPFCSSPYTHSYKVQVSKSQAELSILSTVPDIIPVLC